MIISWVFLIWKKLSIKLLWIIWMMFDRVYRPEMIIIIWKGWTQILQTRQLKFAPIIPNNNNNKKILWKHFGFLIFFIVRKLTSEI
jgi:hypothetical protein